MTQKLNNIILTYKEYIYIIVEVTFTDRITITTIENGYDCNKSKMSFTNKGYVFVLHTG